MIISEVSKEEYEKTVIPALCYNKPSFNFLNKSKVESIHYFIFKDSKKRFGLIVGEKGDVWSCPFSAPFGTFVNIKSKWDIIQLSECIVEFDKYMEGKPKKVRFVLPPDFYAPRIVCVMQNSLFNIGYSLETLDINFQFDLRKCNADNYVVSLPNNGRKNLRIALNSDLALQHCESIQDKKLAYELIRINRESRGYPLNMSCKDVLNTLEIIDHDMFIVDHMTDKVAAALVYHVSDKIGQVIYWGDVPGFSKLKSINYLSHELIAYYRDRGFDYLDIGISTDHGVINYGLSDFKISIGCETSMKMTLLKDYSMNTNCGSEARIEHEAAEGTYLHNMIYLQKR